MSDHQADANQIVQAIAQRLQQQLPPPEPPANPDAARHRLTVVSRFAARVDQLVKQHAALAPSRPVVDQLLHAGRQSSNAIPYRCSECTELFHHEPPTTTASLCAQCKQDQALRRQQE